MAVSPPIPAPSLRGAQYHQGDQPDRLRCKGLAVDEDGKTRDLPTPDPVQSQMAWGPGQVSDKPSTASTPIQIGRCTLRRVIASGGMGTVYEAMQDEPRRIVALKVMRLGVASPSALERFKREAQVLARLRHPCIAQVYEAGMYHDGLGEAPYFVMEYIPNALPITDYAKSRGLDVRQRLELFTQVCDAVHHGHLNGVVHRDLKPSNILVDSGGQIKVIDFGVARATDSDMAVTTMQTDFGQLVGTLQYMSPEQAKADPSSIDARSDVYSLGVVLYQLLTERLPYSVKDATIFEAVRVIRDQPPTRMSTTRRHLYGDMETIVGKALEKDADRRYRSADELLRDIQRYANDEPIVARRPTVTYLLRTRSRAFMVRHPLVCLLLSVATAALAVETFGVAMVYRWTGFNDTVSNAMIKGVPVAVSGHPFDHVCVIRINEETLAELTTRFLRPDQPPFLYPDNIRPLRSFHGELLTRLADTDAAGVAFDITFADESEFDEELLRGISAMTTTARDVLVAVDSWPLGDTPFIGVSPVIRPHVRWGGVSGKFGSSPWTIDLAVQRGLLSPLPSLALCGAASFVHPLRELEVLFDDASTKLLTRYFQRDPNDARVKRYDPATDDVSVTTFEPYVFSGDDEDTGILPGDIICRQQFNLPDDDSLMASTIDFVWALTTDLDKLRQKVDGKIVVVGYTLPYHDMKDTPDGRKVNGVYGIAAGCESLIARHPSTRVERLTFSRVVLVVTAMIGAVLAWQLIGHHVWAIMLLLALIAMMLVLSGLIYHRLGYLVSPVLPSMSLVCSFFLMAVVAGIRGVRTSQCAGPHRESRLA